MKASPFPTEYNNLDSLLINSVETVLEVSIYTPVTSPWLDKTSFTFLMSHNPNIFEPVFFQLVVTNVSS